MALIGIGAANLLNKLKKIGKLGKMITSMESKVSKVKSAVTPKLPAKRPPTNKKGDLTYSPVKDSDETLKEAFDRKKKNFEDQFEKDLLDETSDLIKDRAAAYLKYKAKGGKMSQAKWEIKYIRGEAVPIRAGYVNTESGTQMSLPLYIGKSADPSEGKYVVVDLLPNQKHFHYYGDTPEEALKAFKNGNLYPTGYIFIKIDKNNLGIEETSLIIETNGISTWQMFTTTTGWASIALFVGGAILELVPGGQVAGTYMIVASMTLGAATGMANIYERMQYGELDGGFVTLEVMNIVGSMLAGGGKVMTKILYQSKPLGKLGQFVYYTGEGLDLVDGLFLTVAGAERLKEILDSDMPAAQIRVELVRAISSLILGGYLIANVGGLRNKIPHKNADENINNTCQLPKNSYR